MSLLRQQRVPGRRQASVADRRGSFVPGCSETRHICIWAMVIISVHGSHAWAFTSAGWTHGNPYVLGWAACTWEPAYMAHSHDTFGSVPVWLRGMMNVIFLFQLLSAGPLGSRRVKEPVGSGLAAPSQARLCEAGLVSRLVTLGSYLYSFGGPTKPRSLRHC